MRESRWRKIRAETGCSKAEAKRRAYPFPSQSVLSPAPIALYRALRKTKLAAREV